MLQAKVEIGKAPEITSQNVNFSQLSKTSYFDFYLGKPSCNK